MRLHTLQHVAHEGLGAIENSAINRGCEISYTRFHLGDELPKLDEFDALAIMGGPMGCYDEAIYPWLMKEKRFIAQALDAGKPALGICLGSQLLAEVLGGRVYPGDKKEIGWFPVELLDAAKDSKLLSTFPSRFTPLHWHGDTFELPTCARLLASSAAYPHQAFDCGDKILGLQFHLELTKEVVREFLCEEKELQVEEFVQSSQQILANDDGFAECQLLIEKVLDNWLL